MNSMWRAWRWMLSTGHQETLNPGTRTKHGRGHAGAGVERHDGRDVQAVVCARRGGAQAQARAHLGRAGVEHGQAGVYALALRTQRAAVSRAGTERDARRP